LAIGLLLFRLAWVLGYSGQVESFKAAKLRARRCAERLADLATTHGAVLFVGHGSVNWFIGKELQRMGWICAGNRPRKYWEFTIYSSQAA
jgi:broad specificity phosphatase PhoE